jgi:glutaredoxin/glutathione-dependent peroxiredoxin
MIKPGDRVPSVPVRLVTASGVTETNTVSILGEGLVVLFAVPGAFTPTCDTSHLPGFIANAPKLKAAGVERIVCAAANDHHVVKAWAERSEALDKIDFIADPFAAFADAMGLSKEFGDLGHRYARFAMIIRDGVVDQLFVQDVSGVTVSGAPAVLLALQGAHA